MKREKAIERLTFLQDNACNYYFSDEDEDALTMAIEALQEQRPTGHWLKPTALSEPICSVCLSAPKLLFGKTSAWCPNCGAEMEVEQ